MTLCSWEGHVLSNEEAVQKSMVTPSWSRSQLFPSSCLFRTLRLLRSV